MTNLTLNDYTALAQIVLIVVTFIGIVFSIWFSRATLKETQFDRKLRQMPHLAFDGGGNMIPVIFEKQGKSIPGINPEYVAKIFPNLPEDAISIRTRGVILYGHLKNYGLGSALSTHVVWIPQRIQIGSESFQIDDNKLAEPIYKRELNNMPVCPSHIFSNGEAQLSRLPTFIDKDFEKKISVVEGILEITTKDVFNDQHFFYQEFYIKTDYNTDHPIVMISFGNIIEN